MAGTISHAWAVLDARSPSAAAPPRLRGELQELVAGAMVDAAVPEVGVVPGGAQERLVLAFTPETPARVVGGSFLAALTAGLVERNDGREPDDEVGLAVSLHSGSSDPGSVDDAFLEVTRIADAPVLNRVAAAARWSPVVVAASEAWVDEVGRPAGPGSSRVRSDGDTFWVHVPGVSVVPGVTPSDVALSPAHQSSGHPSPAPGTRAHRPRSGGRTVNVTVHGSVYGDQVTGDKHVDGGTHYGPFSSDGRGTR